MADTSSATPSTSSVTSSSAIDNEDSDSSWAPSPTRRSTLGCSHEAGPPRERTARCKRKWSKVPREAQLTRDMILRGRCVTWQPRLSIKARARNTGRKPRKRTLGEMGPELKGVKKGTAVPGNIHSIQVDSSDEREAIHSTPMGVERNSPSVSRPPPARGGVRGYPYQWRPHSHQCAHQPVRSPAIQLLAGLGQRMRDWE